MRLFAFALLISVFGSRSAFASLDQDLLSSVPPSSTVLAGIDVKHAVTSPSGSVLLRQTIANQKLTKLVTATGLDVRRDIAGILLVGMGQQLNADSAYALLARGTYNPNRLMAAGRLRGASVTRYNGIAILVQGAGPSASAIAFFRPGILAMGDLAVVRAVLGSKARPGGIDPMLRQDAEQIGPTNDIWYATILPGSFLMRQVGDALPAGLRDSGALDRISRSSGGLQFGPSDDNITLDLATNSPGDARFISDVLRLANKLARLRFSGSAGVLLAESVLSSMRVSVEGETVHAVSAAPDEQLERALASTK